MKTWWSPSHLKFKQPPNAKTPSVLHEGALLKFEFEDQKVGYSSLFVWESLGDKSLQEHLRSLFEKSPTTHAQQAIHAARAFAENELIASSPLKNHFLVISLNITKKEIQEAVNAGFEKVKLKIGKNIEGEAAWLRNMSELFPKLRWRLDANASLNFEEFGSFWREISFLHGRIDFVEDPCPFDFEKWKSLSKQVPLALDIEFSHWEECFKKGKVLPLKGLVLKPEAQDAQSLAHLYQEHFEFLTVTSYMSHPMGQVWSGFCSEKLFEKYPNKWVEGGVSSHHVFEENEFSQFLPPTNSLFLFGKKELESFENLLEKCDWQVLG